MCGICCILGTPDPKVKEIALQLSRRLRHRGPDWSGAMVFEREKHYYALCHERLSIVDLVRGEQPLLDRKDDPRVALVANGEIYNHKELRKQGAGKDALTQSDCETILHAYLNHGIEKTCQELDGMFAFVLYDIQSGHFYAARDPIGICPLYFGVTEEGAMVFASEMKALMDQVKVIHTFPPGSFYSSEDGEIHTYYKPAWLTQSQVPTNEPDFESIRMLLSNAVRKRMMGEVPYGVLLSGGLDSSLVASIASRFQHTCVDEDDPVAEARWPLHAFAIGFDERSPDLEAARKVASFLGFGKRYHEWVFSWEDGINALRDVIWHLETCDVTTIRAGTAMYLLSRRIKAYGVKVVLSGDGSDESMAGYLFFHKAPNAAELFAETVRKVSSLSQYDCLRANKAPMSWGVETRVPFLDTSFLDYIMSVNPTYKMIEPGKQSIEKWLLRKAFDTPGSPYLPSDILWRQKEQFSDGIGYSWIDQLKAHCEQKVTCQQMKNARFKFPNNTPTTKEAYYYRRIFDELFPNPSAIDTVPGGPSIACSSSAAVHWQKEWADSADPSGRAVGSHFKTIRSPEQELSSASE